MKRKLTTFQNEEEYQTLKEELKSANDSYYRENFSQMEDQEFDMKMKKLEEFELARGYADDDSPTRLVGSDLVEENMENSHKRPMLSLENTYNQDEVREWYEKCCSALGVENLEIIVNPKWDGCSGAFRYKDGKLYKALTRGNGEYGEDITQNISYSSENIWPSAVSRLGFSTAYFNGEARGEIIITNEGFKELNKSGNYQNPRNLLSGTIKLLDIYEYIPRSQYIKFYAYYLEDSLNKTYAQDLEELKRFNFKVGPYFLCKNLDEINEAITKIENLDLEVNIDGAVLKVNNKEYWPILGATAKYPKWGKAYKYKQETIESQITKIEFWVGRTGKVTPVAFFEPKFLDGSTITKATLNNEDYYRKMDVAEGDTVEIQKAAAIIPQILNVNKRPSARKKIPFPTSCPSCGSKLVKHNEEQADYFCDNPNCKEKIIAAISLYTHSIEADGFADILIERLYNANIVRSIEDLYKLKEKKSEVSRLERLSENMWEKLCNNIESSKNCEVWKTLSGIGIPNIGPKMAKILVKKFHGIKELGTASFEELLDTEGISEITANSIIDFFKEKVSMIQALEDAGVKLKEDVKTAKNVESLVGKIFCITGTLSKPREEYVDLIEAAGGKVVGAVTKKTSYLITNTPNSSTTKNKAAKELGIPILTENELLKML